MYIDKLTSENVMELGRTENAPLILVRIYSGFGNESLETSIKRHQLIHRYRDLPRERSSLHDDDGPSIHSAHCQKPCRLVQNFKGHQQDPVAGPCAARNRLRLIID